MVFIHFSCPIMPQSLKKIIRVNLEIWACIISVHNWAKISHWAQKSIFWEISLEWFFCTWSVLWCRKTWNNPWSIGHAGFLVHLGRFQHCNLGVLGWRTQVKTECRGFYFPCCSISQRKFPNFVMEILALRSSTTFRGLYFS